MNRAYRYRIYPNKEQEVLLSKTLGCVRVLWDRSVVTFNSWDMDNNPTPKYQTSTEMRLELEWMQEVSAAALQQKEIDFKTFRKNFFSKSRKSKIQRCTFKNKFDKQSFRLPNQKFDLKESTIRLEKIGHIKIVIDCRPPSECKYMSVTVTKDKVGNYFASVLVEENITPRFEPTGKAVGIDLGLKHFVTLSTGEKIENPRWFRESQAGLRKAQQHLSRKKKGSSRYQKCKLKVARIHLKTSNQRRWFHHQVSLDLVRRFDFIGMEDLNVAGMKRNRSLAKSVSDAGWGQFASFLRYKSDWNRKAIQEIDMFFPSSKLCGDCGSLNHELKLEDREWVCESCGCVHDRDGNASRNIEVEALRIFNTAQGVACA
jgi:putative transposase